MKGTEKNIRLNKKDKSLEPSQFSFFFRYKYGLVLEYKLQSACSRLFFKGESIVNYIENVRFSFSPHNFFFGMID